MLVVPIAHLVPGPFQGPSRDRIRQLAQQLIIHRNDSAKIPLRQALGATLSNVFGAWMTRDFTPGFIQKSWASELLHIYVLTRPATAQR
jgi:hypothetical protein